MPTYLNDLRLKEITTGDEDGTWGTSTNTNLALIGDAFGLGTKQMAANADETFTMPDATADGTRALYLRITSAVSLTVTRIVTLAPNTVSKVWIIENATTGSQSITISQGSGATVTIAAGAKAVVYTDGAGAGAAVVLANPTILLASGVSGTLPIANGGTGTTSTTFANLTTNVTGTLPIANGGTGATTYTDGQLLIGNSTGNTLTKSTLTAGSGVSITNGSGTISISATGTGGTVTSVSGTGTVNGITLTGTVTTSGDLTLGGTLSNVSLTSQVTDTLPVANGGTGATTLTANNVLLGNGTSALQAVAPSTSGNVLTSNGSTWTSAAPAAGGSLIYISSISASASSAVDFEGLDSTYAKYMITAEDVYLSDSDVLCCRVKIGGTWISTSTYRYHQMRPASDSSSYSGDASGGSARLQLINITSTANNGVGSFTFEIHSPAVTGRVKIINAYGGGVSGSGVQRTVFSSGSNSGTDPVTGVRFLCDAATITGTFRLYGIKNS
jgi:hypothetical protein